MMTKNDLIRKIRKYDNNYTAEELTKWSKDDLISYCKLLIELDKLKTEIENTTGLVKKELIKEEKKLRSKMGLLKSQNHNAWY